MKNIGVAIKSERKPVTVLTAEEVELIIATTKQYRPDYYDLVLLAFRTGMRLGGILALRWGNIDWQRSVILVEKSWRNSVLTETKTGKSRHVDMSDQLIQELHKLRHQRKLEAITHDSSG